MKDICDIFGANSISYKWDDILSGEFDGNESFRVLRGCDVADISLKLGQVEFHACTTSHKF